MSACCASIGKVAAILVFAIVFLFPLYWIVTMAFKPQEEWQPVDGVHWVPENWTLENFKKIFGRGTDTGFFEAAPTDATDSIVSSLVAATGGTLLAMFVGTLTAYGIARYRAGGPFLPFQILQLRMFPPIAIVIPLLIMYSYLELVDTYWGLILIYGAVTFPFVVWLMRSFFQEVPAGDRGGGNRRRLQPVGRVLQGGAAAGARRPRGDRALRVHPQLERLPARARADLEQRGDRARLPERAAVRRRRAGVRARRRPSAWS